MGKEDKGGKGNRGHGKGAVYVVGTGPGAVEHLTERARRVLGSVECVVGYTRYVELISPLIEGKEVFSTGMTHEVERCRKAIEFAREGKRVAVISSGDSGIYGMAGLILQLATGGGGPAFQIEVVPGLPAFVSAASILGAPLMHDFASISLSDLLTEREVIERRVEACAKADFVMVFYNPKSSKRVEGLVRAIDIVRRYRSPDTPAGIVRNATREGEEAFITTLSGIDAHYGSIDMLTIIIIGNSSTFREDGRMITPRGYRV
ncbi:MAG: precorrin-3B C(17)-methyltransferase [Deltaproteobacteria bacterium]|nr:precorrin-3B C(17)-methyltransferase [Deltaproteobacteria bacterium]